MARPPSGRWTSQAQPEPKVVRAHCVNCSRKAATEPKARVMASARGAGIAAALRPEAVPVETVIPHLGGVVEESARCLPDDLFERLVLEGGACDQAVRVVNVGLMMLAVVVVDGFRRDVGSEGIARVGKRGKRDRHGANLVVAVVRRKSKNGV